VDARDGVGLERGELTIGDGPRRFGRLEDPRERLHACEGVVGVRRGGDHASVLTERAPRRKPERHRRMLDPRAVVA